MTEDEGVVGVVVAVAVVEEVVPVVVPSTTVKSTAPAEAAPRTDTDIAAAIREAVIFIVYFICMTCL